MKNLNEQLFKCNDHTKDKVFLNRLSKVIFTLSGNVNVSMRLKGIANSINTESGGNTYEDWL